MKNQPSRTAPPERIHLFGRVYGYPYYKVASSEIEGWYFFFDSGMDDERSVEDQQRTAIKAPVVMDDEQAGDYARAMDMAYTEGKKDGHGEGYHKARREVSDVMSLLCGPVIEAISRNCPHI